MPAIRFSWFAYMLQEVGKLLDRSDLDMPDFDDVLHLTRDGAAFAETQALLGEALLWRYAGVILNLPSEKLGGRRFAPAPRLGANEVVVIVGRPPLDDDYEYDMRVIYRSGSPVEQMVFERLRKLIHKATRTAIVLNGEFAHDNPWGAVAYRVTNRDEKTGEIRRRIRQGTIYRMGMARDLASLARLKVQIRDDTLGYLCWVPGDRAAGIPGILNVFGIGGTETLLWSAYLRRRAEGLIRELVAGDEPRVLAARFERPVLDTIPLDLSMVDGWGEIDWVLDSKHEPAECAA